MQNPKLHAFNRLAFGPRPQDLERDLANLDEHVEEQLYPADIADAAMAPRLTALDRLDMSPLEFLRKYPERRDQRVGLGQLTAAKLLRAVHSERQLQEVMVDFWFNHFNVSAGKGACRVLVTPYEREAIRLYVLGTPR